MTTTAHEPKTGNGIGVRTQVRRLRRSNRRRLPLSSAQLRAWFLQQRDPADATLNHCAAYRMSGPVEPGRLRAAVASVLARHEILRTTYVPDGDGEPRQVVGALTEPAWYEADLSDLAAAARERRLAVLARRQRDAPFRLDIDSPVRFALIRTGAAEFVFLVVAHTICWDVESERIFRGELARAYRGVAPQACRQFADVAGLSGHPGGAEPDVRSVRYWRTALRAVPDAPTWPNESAPASPGAENPGLELSAAALDRVHAFATEQAIEPLSVLLSAFYAIVHRYTGATDFLVSVPVSTRPRDTPVIGYFGNAMLLRAALRPGDLSGSFTEFAAAVDTARAEAFRHSAVGIDHVVREVNPIRAARRDGLEQLACLEFGMRSSRTDFDLVPGEITATPVELAESGGTVPLALELVTRPDGGGHLFAKYQSTQVSGALVTRLLAHYARLLEYALAQPDCRLSDLDPFDADERTALVAHSYGPRDELPVETVLDQLRRCAARCPRSVALVAAGAPGQVDVELTYSALHARANRLAHLLIQKNIGTEDIVALRIGNRVEFVVAALAVWKSGAAYLPVDPHDPDERRRVLDRDAHPALTLDLAGFADAEHAARTLPDTEPSDADRVRPLRPHNLAYVIYTSGSTGRPKGVAVSHAALAEHLAGFVVEGGVTATDTLLLSMPVSFDAALLDLFVTMSVGATLVIPPEGAFADLRHLAPLVPRLGVTVLHVVPATLNSLLALPEANQWRRLRYVPVGGEVLSAEAADRFAGVFDAELRNHYGPTEAVVAATHQRVDGPQGAATVPIGVPNRNVEVHLLDPLLRPVPYGVVGEIYLGGSQLARGYVHRPALSAHSFVADPFGTGQRLYRSGDLARRRTDGVIEFVGRADDQVKIRGYRVELGEVRAAITGYPRITDCAVRVFDDATVGTVLAAYLVTADDAALDLDELRRHVARLLPEYMRPSSYQVVDRIPLTSNGKLDHRGLPRPVRGASTTFRAPATAAEQRIAGRFGAILGVPRVGADDSFFELGGHSLLVNRLLPWIRAEFGVELDVRAVFDVPTVAGLAAKVDAAPKPVRYTMTAAERDRLLGEWSSGVELSDVSPIEALVRRGRTVPGIRPALRCGDRMLTYGKLFAALDDLVVGNTVPEEVSDSASIDGLVALLARLGAPNRDRAGLPRALAEAALTAAVADRRAIAAECRSGAVDPALGSADVRLVAAQWGDRRIAVEMFAALADGATLVLPTVAELAAPALLAQRVRTHAVTHLVATPEFARAIVLDCAPAELSSVRRWDLGGTAAPADTATRLTAAAPDSVVTSAYTPAAYLGPVARGPLDGTGRIRPIPGARVVVLDADRQPVAPGVLGDIYVGGAALLPLAQMPEDRFMTDPMTAGAQLFRTGDTAWWDAEGWLTIPTATPSPR